MDWLPIETAPKDGSRILVGFGRQSGFPVKVVFFNTLHKFWSHYGESLLGLEQNATHWTPVTPPQLCSDERPCVNCFSDQGECLGPYRVNDAPVPEIFPGTMDALNKLCAPNEARSACVDRNRSR